LNITFEELLTRFPVLTVAPYGPAIVVPGKEFNPDWEDILCDQGCRVHYVDLDGSPVTLVQKGQIRGQDEKVVYSPQKEPVMPSIKSAREIAKDARHKRYGDDWQPEEDTVLIELHNKGLPYHEIEKKMQVRFPKRTSYAIDYRIYALFKQGKLKPRFQRRKQKSRTEKVEGKKQPTSTPTSTPISTPTEIPTEKPIPLDSDILKLLKEIRDAVVKPTYDFEYFCRNCGENGSVANFESVYEFCPVCGKPLVIWNIEAD
jgi:hypothetical protein